MLVGREKLVHSATNTADYVDGLSAPIGIFGRPYEMDSFAGTRAAHPAARFQPGSRAPRFE